MFAVSDGESYFTFNDSCLKIYAAKVEEQRETIQLPTPRYWVDSVNFLQVLYIELELLLECRYDIV